MSDKIKICIADDNENVAKNLASYLSLNERIYVTDICQNGKETINSILKKEVDFLITDIIMPEIDGIGVIEKIEEEIKNGNIKHKPNIIIVSALLHDNLKFNILDKGVNYYMTKPIDVDTLEQRIIEIYEYDQDNQYRQQVIDENIKKELYQIGIYPNLIGYSYMKRAVEILIKQPMIQKNFRKYVYTVLAQEDNTEIEKVEKSIINAVNTSWQKEAENVSKILEHTMYHKRKPSTRILLSTIAEKVKNELKSKEI